jgi:UDP-N-acetylmuramate dehydrogenase
MTIQQNIDLTDCNTFGLPCIASRYVKIQSIRDLSSLDFNKRAFVLGGGSNILLPSRIDRLVIHNQIDFIEAVQIDDARMEINVGAGVNWHHLVTVCVKMGWGGIENLALIPGRVGAAPVQNIGAYGVELKDVFISLQAIDRNTHQMVTLDHSACEFGYRNSVFKEATGRYIITSVRLALHLKNHRPHIEYYALQEKFDQLNGIPTIQQVYDAVVGIRSSKLPDPSVLGNSGSFFKNPVVSVDLFEKLLSSFPSLKFFKIDENLYKIPAGYLIEQCGWKGKRVGHTGCYEKQALVIVNYGGASSEEVVSLVHDIKQSVFDTFGIMLQEEVNIIKST